MVIDKSMERSSRVLHHGNPQIRFFFSKNFQIRILTCGEELKSPSFVNICPTLVIDTSMERSSRVLQHENPKIGFFFSKNSKLTKLNFVRTPRKEITLALSISVLHKQLIRQRKGFHEYYIMGTKKFDFFFSKKFEIEFVLYFDLCWRSGINIQVGVNMHLYVDIGDGSLSLWGSTSSYNFLF